MTNDTRAALTAAAAAAILCVSSGARAQTSAAGTGYREKSDANGSSVIFDDDLNSASGLASAGETLKVRGAPARFLLVRPRTSFVQELRKSVENL